MRYSVIVNKDVGQIALRPNFKCFADVYGIGASVSATLGLVGTVATNENNWNMMRAQQNWQTDESAKQRDWQSQERREQNDYNYYQWLRENQEYRNRVNDERQYNTPAAQAQRMMEAGINPATVGADGASDGTFSAPSQAPSVSPGQGSVAQGVTPPYQSAPSYTEGISQIAEAVASLSGANKDDAQAQETKALLNQRLRKLTGEVAAQEIQVEIQSLELMVGKEWKMKKAQSEYLVNMASSYELGERANKETAESLESEERRLHEMAKRNLTNTQFKIYEARLNHIEELIRGEIQLQKSQTNKNNQEAAKAGAETKTINESREYVVQGLKTANEKVVKELFKLNVSNYRDMLKAVDELNALDGYLGSELKLILYHVKPEERQHIFEELLKQVEVK